MMLLIWSVKSKNKCTMKYNASTSSRKVKNIILDITFLLIIQVFISFYGNKHPFQVFHALILFLYFLTFNRKYCIQKLVTNIPNVTLLSMFLFKQAILICLYSIRLYCMEYFYYYYYIIV